MFKSIYSFISLALASFMLASCSTGVPKNITPVTGFDAEAYLGTWYEIARLDHRFERGLQNVTANYAMRDDGGIRVLNRGYNTKHSEWETAEGKAYFVGNDKTGHLKVSFFGPFYGSYVVFDLAEDYSRSYVSGPNKDYLWFLSRTPDVPKAEKDRFKTTASALGYDTDSLIWVDHSKRLEK